MKKPRRGRQGSHHTGRNVLGLASRAVTAQLNIGFANSVTYAQRSCYIRRGQVPRKAEGPLWRRVLFRGSDRTLRQDLG
jgi:hypothetical protein